jgi:hypothetical protein
VCPIDKPSSSGFVEGGLLARIGGRGRWLCGGNVVRRYFGRGCNRW